MIGIEQLAKWDGQDLLREYESRKRLKAQMPGRSSILQDEIQQIVNHCIAAFGYHPNRLKNAPRAPRETGHCEPTREEALQDAARERCYAEAKCGENVPVLSRGRLHGQGGLPQVWRWCPQGRAGDQEVVLSGP